MRRVIPLHLILPLMALIILPGAALASLGGTASNVHAEGARMGAQVSSVSLGGYNRHDLRRANGGMVHEYANANGQVFAVTWSGPGKPDLRTLLGDYFATFQTAGSGIGRTMHSLRRPPQVNQANLQIQTSGHMGWFRGVAFIPSLAPAGFQLANLSQEL